MALRKKCLAALAAMGVATVAYAATQIAVQTPLALSDGTLIVAYGDSPAGAILYPDRDSRVIQLTTGLRDVGARRLRSR